MMLYSKRESLCKVSDENIVIECSTKSKRSHIENKPISLGQMESGKIHVAQDMSAYQWKDMLLGYRFHNNTTNHYPCYSNVLIKMSVTLSTDNHYIKWLMQDKGADILDDVHLRIDTHVYCIWLWYVLSLFFSLYATRMYPCILAIQAQTWQEQQYLEG